jgi:phosphoribosylanthranilate isomerase
MSIEVKICGLTNAEDARVALEAGADYLGFVIYEKSPRGVTVERMAEILAELGDGVRAVGVFVNEPSSKVDGIVRRCHLHAAQIHGDEAPGSFNAFSHRVWRAVWIQDGVALPPPPEWPADRYVIDAAVPGLYGGSGVKADWDVASSLADRYPAMLAGGLRPDNVVDAIRCVSPMGVDVSSGVEAEPGRKDHDAVRAFVAAAKSAGN